MFVTPVSSFPFFYSDFSQLIWSLVHCKRARSAAKMLPTVTAAGTSKSAAAAKLKKSEEVIEVTDGEPAVIVSPPHQAKVAAKAQPEAAVEEEDSEEETMDVTRCLQNLQGEENLDFLMAAQLEDAQARFMQMEGMMRELAGNMNFLHGCMNCCQKRRCM
jgi:hypothetical protein